MKPTINLTIGTDPRGQGGIATMLTILNNSVFFTETNSHILISHKINRKLGSFTKPFYFTLCLFKLFIYLLFYRVKLVHLHMSSHGSYLRKALLIRIIKLFNVKVIIHLHSGGFPNFYSESTKKRKRHINQTFNMADKVIVLSSSALTWVNSIVKDKTKTCIVYNAVPPIQLPEHRTVPANILFLGRLSQNKGVDDLIHAFAQLTITRPNIKLLLAGDGDSTKYRALAADLGVINSIEFLGWISGKKKEQYLADATVYCLPSHYEALGMGILEAMSAGIPVVASTAGGIPDAITNKKEGLLIKAGDVNALAEALRTLLSDDKLRSQYSDAAKIKYQENFSPNVIIPQLKSIYKELLEK